MNEKQIEAAAREIGFMLNKPWKHCEEMATKALQAAEDSAWMPISEAKQDGTEYYILWTRYKYAPGFAIDIGAWRTKPAYYHGDSDKAEEAGWFNDCFIALYPTHFYPLPTPPKETPNDKCCWNVKVFAFTSREDVIEAWNKLSRHPDLALVEEMSAALDSAAKVLGQHDFEAGYDVRGDRCNALVKEIEALLAKLEGK